MPRALSNAEVKELVQLYAQAARNALAAGFDGVEIHCAKWLFGKSIYLCT